MSQRVKIELIVDDKGSLKVKSFGKTLGESTQAGQKGFKSVSGAINSFKEKLTPTTGLVTKLGIAFGLWKLAGVAKGFLTTASSMETYQTTLGTVLKSTERASDMMKWIKDFAATTPFEIPGLVEAATRLEAYGMDAKKYMRGLGDTAAAMGKPIMAAVEMIADASQGEFERMKEFGLRASDVAKEAGFKSVTEMTSTRENLIKGTETLMSMLEKRYSGGMEKLSKTWGGMISNIKDLWTGFQMEVMESKVFDVLKDGLHSVLTKINEMKASGKFKEWAEQAARYVLASFKAMVTASKWVAKAWLGLGEVFAKLGEVALGTAADILNAYAKIVKIYEERLLPALMLFSGNTAFLDFARDAEIGRQKILDFALDLEVQSRLSAKHAKQFGKTFDSVGKGFEAVEATLSKAMSAIATEATESSDTMQDQYNLASTDIAANFQESAKSMADEAKKLSESNIESSKTTKDALIENETSILDMFKGAAAEKIAAAQLMNKELIGDARSAGETIKKIYAGAYASVGPYTGLPVGEASRFYVYKGERYGSLDAIRAWNPDFTGHEGGVIPSYHFGGLLPDERLIKAQTGEGIVSRRGMANLGGPAGLNAINEGESRPEEVHNHFHVHANLITTDDVDAWIAKRLERLNEYKIGKTYSTIDLATQGLDI